MFSASTSISFGQDFTRPPSVYSVSNNDLVQVALSSVDLNRIVVLDDKIAGIHCPKGFCTISKEPDSDGGILLDLANSPSEQKGNVRIHPPFTFFVDTTSGKHYSVLAIPTPMRAQTAIFKIAENAKEKMEEKMKSLAWVTFLTDLQKQAVYGFEHNQAIEGYKKYDLRQDYPNCTDKIRKENKICIEPNTLNSLPMMVFHNGQYNVLVYKVLNTSNISKQLHPSDFYGRGAASIAFVPDLTNVPADGFTYMYEIVDGRGVGRNDE